MTGFKDMINLKQASEAIAGCEKQFSLEHRIFNCTIAFSIAIFIPAILFMMFQGSWPVVGLIAGCIVGYSGIYWLSRFKNKLQSAVLFFYIIVSMLMSTMWIVDRGPMGSTVFFFFALLLVIIFTAEKPLIYIVVMLLDIVLLAIIDGPIQEQIHWTVPPSEIGQVTALLSAVVYAAILAMFYRQLINRRHDDTFIDVIEQVTREIATVNQTADTLAESSDQLLKSTLQQKSATEQLATTTEELNATAEQNNQLADAALDAIKDTEIHLDVSKGNIEKLSQSIEKISSSSADIQSIIDVINDISFQTNILSLNAMIEASRAGASSGGFQIVALEVKKLADLSAEAAGNISKLLKENMRSVQEGVELSNTTRAVFEDIEQRIIPLAETIYKVSDSSAEQNEAIRQISIGLMDIDRAVDNNKNLAEETATTASELRKNAISLKQVVKILKESSQKNN